MTWSGESLPPQKCSSKRAGTGTDFPHKHMNKKFREKSQKKKEDIFDRKVLPELFNDEDLVPRGLKISLLQKKRGPPLMILLSQRTVTVLIFAESSVFERCSVRTVDPVKDKMPRNHDKRYAVFKKSLPHLCVFG